MLGLLHHQHLEVAFVALVVATIEMCSCWTQLEGFVVLDSSYPQLVTVELVLLQAEVTIANVEGSIPQNVVDSLLDYFLLEGT